VPPHFSSHYLIRNNRGCVDIRRMTKMMPLKLKIATNSSTFHAAVSAIVRRIPTLHAPTIASATGNFSSICTTTRTALHTRSFSCQKDDHGGSDVETQPLVKVDVSDTSGVAVVTLNRPEARNALSTALVTQLLQSFVSLDQDYGVGRVRAVVLTGAGTAFCAGADLKERRGMTDEQWEAQHKCFQKAALAFRDLPMPTIAAVNGAAFGGGLELVCLADWAFASPNVKFGFPEVHLGIFPGMGATVTLPRLIGPSLARRWILTGQTQTAEEGYRARLFVEIVSNNNTITHKDAACDDVQPPSAALEAALKDAERIAQNGPMAVRQGKRSIRQCGEMPDFRQAWDHALELYGNCFRSEERMEGIAAYNEKRKPNF
jgi:enoyl-CoA hydratase